MNAAELFDIKGLGVIITGAASGLGLAYAEIMAESGAKVTLLDVSAEKLDAAISRLRKTGAIVRGAIVDVTDRQAVFKGVEAAVKEHGRLDIVFANAGIVGGSGFMSKPGIRAPEAAIENFSLKDWSATLDTNLTGVLHMIQAVVPHFKTQRSGRIIVTTSRAAFRNSPRASVAYHAAKAAAAHLVRQAALELAEYNILVNAIAPGAFATNIAGGISFHDPAVRATFEKAAPLKRVADPNEIKGIALFLASPAASYVTGAQFVIDGGASLGESPG